MDEYPTAVYSVKCGTLDCVNAGERLELPADAVDPYIFCGPCGELISDIALVVV